MQTPGLKTDSRRRQISRSLFVFFVLVTATYAGEYPQAAIAAAAHSTLTCEGSGKSAPKPQSSPSSSPSSLSYGMNFVWWRIDVGRVPICATGNTAATTSNYQFLPKYDDASVRSAVRGELAAMHKSGFDEIRTLIFFAPEAFGNYFQIGHDDERVGQLLSAYVSDVAAAGIHHLEIEFSAAGSASPVFQSGQAYNSQAVPRTIDFILEARRALGPQPRVDLSVDLLNESCNWHQRNRQVQSNLNDYLPRLVSAYVTAYPKDKTTISCGAPHMPEGRVSIDAAYAAAGRSGPDYYEVHLYDSGDPRVPSVAEMIGQVRTALAGSRTPIVLGETGYGNARSLSQIVSGLKDVGGGLRAVYFWPKRDMSLRCSADVPPPYALNDALGGSQ